MKRESLAVPGGLLFTPGRLAADAEGRLTEAARVPDAFPYYGSPIKRQARVILEDLRVERGVVPPSFG